ncbi:hypothetical protein [Mesorhizobium comanense]|jgi:hypothetical protein|uniref:hypothetical protein n=1 Tax=Mesorhizobium comanense TaxID=2502215 RepID=UPI0014856DE3|nr:hypothetical protein [Mesorhizobium comanense]
MPIKPNYQYERSQRDKLKAAKKEAKLASKSTKAKTLSPGEEETSAPTEADVSREQ